MTVEALGTEEGRSLTLRSTPTSRIDETDAANNPENSSRTRPSRSPEILAPMLSVTTRD
jgi:hypothetical protein